MRAGFFIAAVSALALCSCGPSKPPDPKLSVVGTWQGADAGNAADRSLMVFNSNRTFGSYQGTTMLGTWEQSGQTVSVIPTGRVDRWDIRSGAMPGNTSIVLLESDDGKTLSNASSGSVMFARSHSR